MFSRFNSNDVRIISHYLGLLIMIFGAFMVMPLIVSILYAEWDICCHYVLGIGIALTLGSLLRLAKIDPQRMGRKHAIAITGMVWIIGAVLAAVPLYLSGHYATFLDAVFEGVSGLTATGLSLVQDVDHLSMADNMWRFAMQLVGGQGVVVVALSLGLFVKTGNTLYSSEGREESVVPNIRNTARFIWKFALAAVLIGTLVMTVILIVMGMEPLRGFFHGLWITIGAYDTGGFAPGSLSLVAYHSWPLEIIAMLLMMFGALNFALVAQVHKGNWKEFVRDIEVRTLALWTTAMVVVFVAALAVGDFLTDYSGLMRRGIFTIISATTNTGFQVLSTAQITTLFSSGAFFLVAVSMAVGGSSASTAGGIKPLRVGLIFKGIGLHIKKILQPRSAQITTYYNHIGRHQLVPELLSSAMIIAALYIISYTLGALAGIAFGYEALHSIFESISAASNAGLSSGIIQPGMPVLLEILYILQMWLGRLEFITLLALFASLATSLIPRRKPKVDGAGTKGSIKTLCAVVVSLLLAAALFLAPFTQAHASQVYAQDSATSKQPSASETLEDALGKEVSISELAEVPEHLDGVLVLFEAEMVGDIIHADSGYIWVTASDGSGSISVYLTDELAKDIEHLGTYDTRGTQLKLLGEFHLACDQHDGSSDVHVSSVVEIVDPGGKVGHEVDYHYLAIGLVLIAAAVVLMAIYSVLRKKRL